MWKFYQPANVIFGEGELANLGKYMDERLWWQTRFW